MARVQVEFTGVSSGIKRSASEARTAIRGVSTEARQGSKGVDSFSESTGRSHTSLLKLAAGAFAAVGAYRLVTGAVRGAWEEMQESVKVAAQTEQVLKSTGATAGVTAKQIDEMASALMRKSGVDDEVIKNGANLLLTFRDVRNEAGAGNDVFNQATRAALDMSVALGTDMKSAALQLGKALNDPIQGLTALRRAGVSFTEQQREQIKTLVEHGKALEAQKIVLHEVQMEFGGQAEVVGKTLPGKINILKESWRNLTADILKGLSPSLGKVVEWLQKQVDWLQNSQSAHDKLREAARQVAEVIRGVVEAMKSMLPVASGLWQVLRKVADVMGGWDNAFKLILAGTIAAKVLELRRAFLGLALAETAAGTAAVRALPGIAALAAGVYALTHPDILTKHFNIIPKTGIGPLDAILTEVGLQKPGPGRGPTVPAHLPGSEASESGLAYNKTVGGKVTSYAKAHGPGTGTTYHWGGVSPQTGYDCSGYLYAAYKAAGVTIPRTTRGQWNDPHAVEVPRGQERNGDGVYFVGSLSGKNAGPPPGHVGIYIGGGLFIEYFSEGKPAKMDALNNRGDYMGARRWVKIAGDTGGDDSGDRYTPHDAAAFKKTAAKTGGLVSSMNLLSLKTQTQITRAERTEAIGDDVAALEKALEELHKKLKTASGKQRVSIENEITAIQKKLDSLNTRRWKQTLDAVNKAAADSLRIATERTAKARAELEKASDAAKEHLQVVEGWVQGVQSSVSSAWAKVTTKILAAFDKQTDLHVKGLRDALQNTIDKVLAPQYFQGVDAAGRPRLTPKERQIADIQKAQEEKRYADAIVQARHDLEDAQREGDQEKIDSANKQLDAALKDQEMHQLELEAAEERRQADLDYAAAVKARQDAETAEEDDYVARRTAQREALSDQLDLFGASLAAGTATLDDLNVLLGTFGITTDDVSKLLGDDVDPNSFKNRLKELSGWVNTLRATIEQFLNPAADAAAAALRRLESSVPPGYWRDPWMHFAEGGKVPGRYIGREDTVMARVSPGETVIDRTLTRQLELALAAGQLGRGGGASYGPIYVLGVTDRQVAAALKQLVDGAPDVPSYRSPRG